MALALQLADRPLTHKCGPLTGLPRLPTPPVVAGNTGPAPVCPAPAHPLRRRLPAAGRSHRGADIRPAGSGKPPGAGWPLGMRRPLRRMGLPRALAGPPPRTRVTPWCAPVISATPNQPLQPCDLPLCRPPPPHLASPQPLEFFLSGSTGSLLVVAVAALRIFLGWKYVGDRLLTASLEYEETGWCVLCCAVLCCAVLCCAVLPAGRPGAAHAGAVRLAVGRAPAAGAPLAAVCAHCTSRAARMPCNTPFTASTPL